MNEQANLLSKTHNKHGQKTQKSKCNLNILGIPCNEKNNSPIKISKGYVQPVH